VGSVGSQPRPARPGPSTKGGGETHLLLDDGAEPERLDLGELRVEQHERVPHPPRALDRSVVLLAAILRLVLLEDVAVGVGLAPGDDGGCVEAQERRRHRARQLSRGDEELVDVGEGELACGEVGGRGRQDDGRAERWGGAGVVGGGEGEPCCAEREAAERRRSGLGLVVA